MLNVVKHLIADMHIRQEQFVNRSFACAQDDKRGFIIVMNVGKGLTEKRAKRQRPVRGSFFLS